MQLSSISCPGILSRHTAAWLSPPALPPAMACWPSHTFWLLHFLQLLHLTTSACAPKGGQAHPLMFISPILLFACCSPSHPLPRSLKCPFAGCRGGSTGHKPARSKRAYTLMGWLLDSGTGGTLGGHGAQELEGLDAGALGARAGGKGAKLPACFPPTPKCQAAPSPAPRCHGACRTAP